jgi:predicted amidohydrolase
LKVTVCEMPDNEEGFSKAWGRLAKHVSKESSDLVLLPEMPFSHWFCASPKFNADVWHTVVRRHEAWIRRLGELGAPVVLGSQALDYDGRRLNRGFAWTEKKGAKGVHDKGYLPNEEGYYEATWYQRGDGKFTPFEVLRAKAGMMICSDIWAMNHARAYGKAGAHLVAVPHAAPRQSIEKWIAAGKVVAVISGAYCIASNRTGRGSGIEFGGSGWVISPEGKLIGVTSKEKPFLTAEIDLSVADRAKSTYPRDALRPD